MYANDALAARILTRARQLVGTCADLRDPGTHAHAHNTAAVVVVVELLPRAR